MVDIDLKSMTLNQFDGKNLSVIIPCFNSERTIMRAIESVLNADCVKEVIVVDDGSTDGSTNRVKTYFPSVKLLTGSNHGASHARNLGLSLASGGYVLFLDADDYLDPGYIECLSKAADGDTDVLVGGHRQIGLKGNTIRDVKVSAGLTSEQLLASFLHQQVQTGAFLWKRDFVIRNGGWSEDLAMAQDVELVIRMMLQRPTVKVVDSGDLRAIWQENDDPNRITNSFTRVKANSVLSVLTRHTEAIMKLDNKHASQGLAKQYYALARRAFGAMHDEVAGPALAMARNLGLRGHPGGAVHKLVCELLGLRIKVRIGRWAGRVRYR